MNMNQINLTSSSDKISIDFSSKDANASKLAVREAKDGKVTQKESMDVSDQSTRLKEMECQTKEIETPKMTSVSVETDKAAFKEHLEKSLGDKEEALASEKEIAGNKESLENVAGRITASDYEELIKEGDILKAYEVIRLEEALTRVKEQRVATEQGLKDQVQVIENSKEQIVLVGAQNKRTKSGEEEIVQKLEEANLPVTETNIIKISAAMELAGSLKPMSEKEMGYLLKNEAAPTIENLYKATYSSGAGSVIATDRMVLEGLMGQIDAAIEGFGMDVNPKTQEQAVFLLSQDIPVTKANLVRLGQLETVNEVLREKSMDQVLDQVIAAVAGGIAPEATNLYDPTAEVQGVIAMLQKVSDAGIKKAVEYQVPVTLRTLAKAEQSSLAVPVAAEEGIAYVTAKRQLEEIRLKMTIEAGVKLAGKGLHIETEELSKIVEALREQEDSYYRNLLKEAKVDDSSENMEVIKGTTAALAELKTVPSYVLGQVQKDWQTVTVGSLHTEGMALKAQLDKANTTYDTLMTQPRKDLGDSMKKALESVDALLSELDLEATAANQRAVKILGYNQMEITKESILAIKTKDLQLNALMKELHPAVVVDMIREGVNPLNTQIDQLHEWVQERKQDMGIEEDEKYSQFLWKLEKEEGITPEERKSFVGIYRLLNNVEKTDGAALGAVVKAGQEVTLNHLLSAVRSMKSSGMDVKVDDEFGALESIQYSSESITSQIEAGYQQPEVVANQVAYMEQVLNGIMEELSPGKLSHAKEKLSVRGNLMEVPLETLQEELINAPNQEESVLYEEQLQSLREHVKNAEEPLRLLQQMNLPATVQNIMTATEYLGQAKTLFQRVKDLDVDATEAMAVLEEGLTDGDSMENAYSELESKVQTALNRHMEASQITSGDLAQLKSIRNGMNFITKLSHSRSYEIPIQVGDSITNMNLTLVTGTKDTGKIEMHVQSETLGSVAANFSVKGNELKGMILSDSRQGIDLLKANKDTLTEAITDADLLVRQLDYGTHKIKQNNQARDLGQESEVAHASLYRVAKILVTHIKELELQNQGAERKAGIHNENQS